MQKTGAAPRPGSGEPPPMEASAMTHTGKRPRNEDCHLLREDLGLAIVADGFSGTAGGDIAARVAVDEIAGCLGTADEQTLPAFEAEDLSDGIAAATVRFGLRLAHTRIQQSARTTGPLGMSTAAAVLVLAGPNVVVGHAGNVDVYRLRGVAFERLTRDDRSATGGFCPIGGAEPELRPTVRVLPWQRGDVFAVATAGLHRVLGPEGIRLTLATHPRPKDACAALIGRALHAGGTDNMTAIVLRPAARGGPRVETKDAGMAEEIAQS